MYYDEITGIHSDKPIGSSEPLWVLISTRTGGALACASSYRRAAELQMLRGWRTCTRIKRIF